MLRRFALLGVALVVVLLVVAQLVLPGIAARRLRDQLARSGKVISVSVSAFPAIELLWHHAGEVDVDLSSYRSRTTGSLGQALEQTAEAGTINATIGTLNSGLVTLQDVSLRKRGDVLRATATLTQANLRAALPAGLEVKPVASGDGELVLQGSALGLTVDATLSARDGVLRITPDVPLIGGLLTLTVFQDPRVDVEAVGARSVAGGYSMFATARLR